jgi:hypothetical protein
MRRMGHAAVFRIARHWPTRLRQQTTFGTWIVRASSSKGRRHSRRTFSRTARLILCDTCCADSTAACLKPLGIPKVPPGREHDKCRRMRPLKRKIRPAHSESFVFAAKIPQGESKNPLLQQSGNSLGK